MHAALNVVSNKSDHLTYLSTRAQQVLLTRLDIHFCPTYIVGKRKKQGLLHLRIARGSHMQVHRNPAPAIRLGGFARLANNCVLISVPLCTLLYIGGHLTILIDETTLNSNSEAMGQVLSSTEIIRRLRHHITSVRYLVNYATRRIGQQWASGSEPEF